MGTYKRTEGQTIIETAIMLVLLLLILFGITEFSRAWYTKNSLKNAVRHGARVAVVTTNTSITSSFTCTNSTSCPNTDAIINAVCCQPGVPRSSASGPGTTSVSIACSGSTTACGSIIAGDTVTLTATTTFSSVVGSSFWPWLQAIPITTDASMRYE